MGDGVRVRGVRAAGIVLAALVATAARGEEGPAVEPESTSLDLPYHLAWAELLAAQDDQGASGQAVPGEPPRRLRSWELPAVSVVGEAPAGQREEELIGTDQQPRWTATRRFPTTRVYVIPEGKIEVEAWARATIEDSVTSWRFLQEIEIGLPHRFQVDLYLRQDYDTEDTDLLWGGQFEVRWALADWGVIWGNPTLYLEYIVLEDRPDKIEPKILFGGEIVERWHWGANVVAEFELGGDQEFEYKLTGGVSYTVVDSVFQVGVESTLTLSDTSSDRGDFSTSVLIGPSFQWRPTPPMTVNVAPLVGVTSESPEAQIWFNVGWEF